MYSLKSFFKSSICSVNIIYLGAYILAIFFICNMYLNICKKFCLWFMIEIIFLNKIIPKFCYTGCCYSFFNWFLIKWPYKGSNYIVNLSTNSNILKKQWKKSLVKGIEYIEFHTWNAMGFAFHVWIFPLRNWQWLGQGLNRGPPAWKSSALSIAPQSPNII